MLTGRIATALLTATIAGCALVNLREETRAYYRATVLVGQVMAPPGWTGPVVVAALGTEGHRTVIGHRVWLHEPGGYELIVAPGRYTVVAFGDSNRNGSPDAGEPAAALSTPVEAMDSGMMSGLDIHMTGESASAVAHALRGAPGIREHSTQAGAIADLDSPAFSADAGKRGYWSPLETFRQLGGNVYFLEPYDPRREAVLFVHGAAGSGREFRQFYENLDRSRYQAWFFQYPSGAPLDSMAHLLFWKLLNLQMRYGFERLHVVAHSMGGLVTRRFLLNHGNQFPQLGQWVTLSTPWGGESAATQGVQHSPAVIPSWRDMQPEGDFLRNLFQQPLPGHVRHTLLFGHRGGYNLLRPTTDGTVTLASQLRPEAQAEAQLVMGFDEDHVSILASPEVLRQVTQALHRTGGAGVAQGQVQVEIAYSSPSVTLSASTPPFLMLERVDAKTAPVMIPLPQRLGLGRVGPIATGIYDVRLLASGFRGANGRQRIEITGEEVAVARLELEPQGVIANYVGADGDALTYPAGSWRPPHDSVRIEKIVLRGAGIERTLVPTSGGIETLWESYLEDRDAAAGAMFSFVGLGVGEYQIEIHARGYRTHTSRYQVVPGRPAVSAPIVLTRH